MRKDAQVVAHRGVARQLAIAIAGFGALGAAKPEHLYLDG